MKDLSRFLAIAVLLCMAQPCLSEDWPKYRRDLNNSGASAETTITQSNVTQLALKWSFNIGGSVTASPAVATVNGTSIAFVGGWNGLFYAVNAVTGAKIWSFQVDLVGPCTSGNCRIASSANVSNGIVYFGAENAYLYALNASTGALVWKQQLGDPNSGYEIWSSPAVYNGTVYVGLASHGDNPCVVGKVIARNASTGAAIWSFSTIDQTTCSNGNCVGAGVWTSPAIDTTNGVLYVGTGNPGSTCSPPTPNAAKYPDSILALKLINGQLLNYYQAITNDNSDDDFGSSPVIFRTSYSDTCSNTNHDYEWIGEANKNGSLYTIAAGSAGLSGSAASISLDSNGFIASPAVGLHTHSQNCQRNGDVTESFGEIYLASGNGSGGKAYKAGQGTYSAPNMALAWSTSVSYPAPMYSAPALIGGNEQQVAQTALLLAGSDDHHLYALNGDTGAVLWSYATGGAIDSGPAVSNGRVYFGSSDGYLRCLSLNGQ
jgi:polyvinyl alcohol dehydrogenase (cytochrome)